MLIFHLFWYQLVSREILRCELTDYEWNAIKPFRPNKPRGDAPCWQSALARKEGVIVWLIIALMGSNEGFVPDLIGDRALRYAVARVFHRHRHHQPAARAFYCAIRDGGSGSHGPSVARAALTSFGFWLKAPSEEQFLRIELGPESDLAYRRRVRMFVPFICLSERNPLG